MADDSQAAEAPIPVIAASPGQQHPSQNYDEFEVGEHKVPWFLWVFFILIVSWASVSWIQFFGY
jgi:hypothetical protein